MVWLSRCEEYVGEWADDAPHGQGVHSWYAHATPPGVPPQSSGGWGGVSQGTAPLDTRSPGAALVGRYSGDFQAGERHGFGTFWYLHGAR